MNAAIRTLEKNRSTVALADMEEMLGEEGFLARFRAAGYAVTGP